MTLHSLDAFWTPSERIFLAKVALGRHGGHGVAVAPSLHGHSREELKECSARVTDAIAFFRTIMKELRQDIPRDDFKRVQILYYQIKNYIEAIHAANLEQTSDDGYRGRKLATLYETPEWRAFARISDRFRQATPKYRRRKRAYDAERNAREEVRAARRTPEARARIAFNERRAEASHEEVRVVFQPLLFRGPKSDVSRRALPLLGDQVTVGFVEVGALSDGLADLDQRAISEIGPLRCERDVDLLART